MTTLIGLALGFLPAAIALAWLRNSPKFRQKPRILG